MFETMFEGGQLVHLLLLGLKCSEIANFRPALRTWPELKKFWPELYLKIVQLN
jgi:hypothetical protein